MTLKIKSIGVVLLVFIVVTGIGSIHLYLHQEAEKDNENHNPETCLECATIKSLGSEKPQAYENGHVFVYEEFVRAIIHTPIHRKNLSIHSPLSRAPPVS